MPHSAFRSRDRKGASYKIYFAMDRNYVPSLTVGVRHEDPQRTPTVKEGTC